MGPAWAATAPMSASPTAASWRSAASARRRNASIDADGLIVAPGFIDGHTHMDAQVNWDRQGTCSCWHGVTSVIMGNCGFALAPCPPAEREWFARCLTAVEDIPLEAMLAGIDWRWETFPEYLATVERLPKALNYGAYIGHSALRMYVMGKRALTEPATEDDIARMVHAVKEAVRAGAMGFSSSRAGTHVTPDDTPVASRIAEWSEIDALVGAMAELDAGIFQIGPDVSSGPTAARVPRTPAAGGIEIGPAGDVRHDFDPAGRGAELRIVTSSTIWIGALPRGARMFGQTTTKSINAIFALKSYLPFDGAAALEGAARPAGRKSRSGAWPILPCAQQLVADEDADEAARQRVPGWRRGDHRSAQARLHQPVRHARRGVERSDRRVAGGGSGGKHPVEVMLDLMLANEDQVFVQPLVNEGRDDVLDMLRHPWTLATFSDSGAHVCQEMGSSLQTHMLSYWVRARQAFTLEQAVRKLTFDNAAAWELNDRGLVRTGFAADLVVFDEAHGAPDDAGGGGRSARRRAAAGAEGGGYRRNDRQRPGGVRERRRDGRVRWAIAEGEGGGLTLRGAASLPSCHCDASLSCCHCEERSDQAISRGQVFGRIVRRLREIASSRRSLQ